MRRFRCLVFLCAALIPALAAAGEEAIVLNYVFPAPLVRQDGSYARVTMGDLPLSAAAGQPALPYRPLRVLVPAGRRVLGVEIETGALESLPGRYLVQPAEQPVPLSFKGTAAPTAPDPSTYRSLSPFPPSLKSGVTIQGQGPYRVLLLNLNPVTYLPGHGDISWYRMLTVRVRLSDAASRDAVRMSATERRNAEESLRGKVENPAVLSTYGGGRKETGLTAALANYPHVIITNAALESAPDPWNFQALRDHRAARGMPSTIVTTEYIYENFSGTKPNGQSDNQTRIRNFIAWAHENWGTQYVLLGGYSGIIPVRYLQADGTNIPADMYYGNLDGTFDNDADGVYGESTDGPEGGEVDLYAEVYVGRACVENETEVANFVRKTIAYETSNADYLHRARMVGEHLGFGGVAEYAAGTMEEIRCGSSSAGYTTKGFAENDFFATSTLYDSETYAWDKSELIAVMNSGVHILNHLGHANYTYDMKLYTSDLSALTNTDYFFTYSQGCMPGGFDTAQCFGEVITTTANGAFAAVLNARYGWGTYDSTAGPSQYYDREFWDALFGEGIRTIGRMNADSKEDNDFRINGSCMRWCFYELNLFGDPAIEFQSVSSRGTVGLDANAYAIPGAVTVMVMDADLDANTASPDTVTVTLTSGTETAPESVLLTETGVSTKTFRGSIGTGAGSAVPGDGILQVSDGDTITVTYHDADNGSGSPADVTDTALVDGAAPVISNIRFTPSAKFCVITWDTDEPATSAVDCGTASPPGTPYSAAGLATSHSIRLTGLSPLTTYYFSVTSADAVGNSTTDVNGGAWRRFTTPDYAALLFVDDDEGDAYESCFTNALDAGSYRYDAWDVAALGSAPAAADLAPYQAVVWNCGSDYSAANAGITPPEEGALTGYLDGGGSLFLCGQDILYNNISDPFRTGYLHIGNYSSDDSTASARGIDGDRVSDGMTLALSYPFANYSDSLAPGAGASGAFITDGTTTHPYCGISYPADGVTASHRVVFFAFPFESINASDPDPNNTKTVMDRVLCYISPVQITGVSPAYGLNDRAVTMNIAGTNFKTGLTLSLGDTPLSPDTLAPGRVEATVPAGVAAGSYDITIKNTDTVKGSTPGAYTALTPSADNDGDGLSNEAEVLTHRTDPLLADTDDDGLSDAEEINAHHTDPLLADTDSDGLPDGEEISRGTDPWKGDTDGDGVSDYIEIMCGADPLSAAASVTIAISFQPPSTAHPSSFAPDAARGFDSRGYGWHE